MEASVNSPGSLIKKSLYILFFISTIWLLLSCVDDNYVFPSQCTGGSLSSVTMTQESRLTPRNSIGLQNKDNRIVEIEHAFPNLRFSELTNLSQPDGESDRIFVTEHSGCIYVFPNDPQVAQTSTFLNLTGKIRLVDEDGLLGMAFDPEFRINGHFYVYYVASKHRRALVSRFSVSKNDHNKADPNTEQVILEIPLPSFRNHSGGKLAFGPDGNLYISVGDGGLHGKLRTSQNNTNLLGTILRIDVSKTSGSNDYAIPSGNPFSGVQNARDEIWAYGFRNPWGMDFDDESGFLWVTDTGRTRLEEVNLVESGLNYGWPMMEGTYCFNPDAPDNPPTSCDQTGLIPPLLEYDRNKGCAIVGGYVYRGIEIEAIAGGYIYGDYCSGRIWVAWYDGKSNVQQDLLVESQLAITAFGEDLAGNIYILDAGGVFHLSHIDLARSSRKAGIYRLVPTR